MCSLILIYVSIVVLPKMGTPWGCLNLEVKLKIQFFTSTSHIYSAP